MIVINIMLGIVAAVLLFGVIGEQMPSKQKNIAIVFCAVVALIIAVNTVM